MESKFIRSVFTLLVVVDYVTFQLIASKMIDHPYRDTPISLILVLHLILMAIFYRDLRITQKELMEGREKERIEQQQFDEMYREMLVEAHNHGFKHGFNRTQKEVFGKNE